MSIAVKGGLGALFRSHQDRCECRRIKKEGNAGKMETQRRLERIKIASSLVGLALEFALLGIRSFEFKRH
jgi:hypothetical protein